jgi:hypothetical protein
MAEQPNPEQKSSGAESLSAGAGSRPPMPQNPGSPPDGSQRITQRLSDLTNNKCPNCGLVNRVGVLVCENCGTSLIAGAASVPATRSLQDPKAVTGRLFPDQLPDRLLNDQRLPFLVPPSEAKLPPLREASAQFEDDMILRLEIEGATIPILVYPKKETLIGRRDVTSGTMPDVDLTSYAGYRMGVSRRHAILKLLEKRLELVDLGSSNGSMLNGIQVQPHHPQILRDGDEMVLGKMTMRVVFQNGAQRTKRI